MSTHASLNYPRTDGDPSRWPATARAADDDTYYEECGPTEARHIAYETKIGQYLAQLKGLPNASAQKAKLPPGYKIFGHFKKQHDGSWRSDYYLYGSTTAPKFRSTVEFQDHAAWLMDTSKPLDDHSQCGCKYNKYLVKRESLAGSSKRPSSSSPLKESSTKRKKASAPSEVESDDGQPSVVPERADELQSQRRFRRGELIWFKVDNLVPPPELKARNSPTITHWPGLIANVAFKSRVLNPDGVASASSSAAWTLFGGSAPSTLAPEKQVVIHYHEYHIRPLGMFDPKDEVIKDTKEMLPWAVGNELLGGANGWDVIGGVSERILREGVKKEGAKDKGKQPEELEIGLSKRWRENWAARIKFRDMARDYERANFRLGIAINIAHGIAQSWTQTDKIEVLFEDPDISKEDMQAIQSQKKTLYQGLWWGGERIWLEDLVRLKKTRGDLPTDSLLPPTEGSLDRAVFFKIRVIALEVSLDHTPATQTAWRCLLYGDIYELAEEGSAELTNGQLPTPTTAASSNGNGNGVVEGDLSSVLVYKPPKGYVYRQLNDPGSEVTCDIIDVAGRVYPDLLDGTTQTWYIDPGKPTNDEDQKGRVQGGEHALSVIGLKAGTTVASFSTQWKEDLYDIVQSATKENEKSVKAFYMKLLRNELGLPPLPSTLTTTTTNATTTTTTPKSKVNGAGVPILATALDGPAQAVKA